MVYLILGFGKMESCGGISEKVPVSLGSFIGRCRKGNPKFRCVPFQENKKSYFQMTDENTYGPRHTTNPSPLSIF